MYIFFCPRHITNGGRPRFGTGARARSGRRRYNPSWLDPCGLIALIALGALGRVAVEAAAETLLDAIGKLPFERLDLALLHALVVSSENRPDTVSVGYGSEAILEPTTELLTTRLERDHRPLWEAITRIAENTEVLTRIVQTISDRSGQSTAADLDGLADVKLAIDRLTATVNRLPDLVQLPVSGSEETPPRLSSREGDLGRDLARAAKRVRLMWRFMAMVIKWSGSSYARRAANPLHCMSKGRR